MGTVVGEWSGSGGGLFSLDVFQMGTVVWGWVGIGIGLVSFDFFQAGVVVAAWRVVLQVSFGVIKRVGVLAANAR